MTDGITTALLEGRVVRWEWSGLIHSMARGEE